MIKRKKRRQRNVAPFLISAISLGLGGRNTLIGPDFLLELNDPYNADIGHLDPKDLRTYDQDYVYSLINMKPKRKSVPVELKSISDYYVKQRLLLSDYHLKNESSQNHLDQKKLILSENFNVVLICSKKKKKSNFDDYPEIKFKAVTNKINEFHPDDLMPNSDVKWRKYLEEHQNDKSLLSAFDLYSRKEYRSLYEKFNKCI